MTTPRGYVDQSYLRVLAEMLTPFKLRTYELMRISEGANVLDVGCGPGTDTIPLAQMVGATGRVAGVDHDAGMLVEADRRAVAGGVAAIVEHRQGDATALPFEDGEFDSCRSERLFQHLPEPEKALAEMVRVTRPGGMVVVLDTDYGSSSVDTAYPELERKLNVVRATRVSVNGFAARGLYRLFKRQGLEDVTAELCPLSVTDYTTARYVALLDRTEQAALEEGIVTQEEIDRLHADFEQAHADGVFFASINLILVSGRKP